MNAIFLQAVTTIYSAGLNGLWETIKSNWLGPLFFAGVAIMAIIFIKDRAWMKLLAFVGIAAVVGVLIFAGDAIFGQGNSGLTGVAKDASNQVSSGNTIVITPSSKILLK